MGRKTRRELLRTAAGGIGAGGLAATAGCAGILGEGDAVSVPEPGPPTYRKWIRDHTREDGYDDFLYAYKDHERMRSLDDVRPDGYGGHFEHKLHFDYFGVDYARIRETLFGYDPGGGIVAGDFTRDEVVAALGETGYTPNGTYRGFRLFMRSDHPRIIAAGDGTVVQIDLNHWNVTVSDPTRQWIDVLDGTTTLLHETDDLFAETTEVAGGYPMLSFGNSETSPADVPGQIAASSLTFVDSGEVVRFTSGFSSSATVSDEAAVRSFVTENYHEGSIVASDSEGRVATATVLNDSAEYGPAVSAPDYPLVTFGAEYDAGAGVVTIRHEAGEPVAAERLRLQISASGVRKEFDKKVTPGTSMDVSAEPGDSVEVVFEAKGGGLSDVLLEYTVPG